MATHTTSPVRVTHQRGRLQQTVLTSQAALPAHQHEPALNTPSWNFAAISVEQRAQHNTLLRKPQEEGGADPLPYAEAMEETEKGVYDTYIRDCNGVRVLQRLDREDPISPSEKVRRLEDRIKFIRHYFRVNSAVSNPVERAQLRCVVDCIFGKGYGLTSEEAALAATQCELSETQWKSFALARHGHIPGGARHLPLDKLPWIPDPKVCFSADKMEELKKGILAGKGCEGESGKAEPVVF